jgi:hypothetical protein
MRGAYSLKDGERPVAYTLEEKAGKEEEYVEGNIRDLI